MPNLSTTPTQPAPWGARSNTFVPFTATIRVVPDRATGKRWSLWRNLEKTALRVENDLETAGFNIATPVAFTPQFGDFSARLTVVGFLERSQLSVVDGGDGRKVEAPTTNIDFIHSGTDPDEKTDLIDGNRGGSLAEAQDPTNTVDTEVSILRGLLVSASNLYDSADILSIEYNGVKYGLRKQGGRSFPS
jgi:hypothetical protein